MSGVAPALPKFQFSSSVGVPLASGTLTVYLAGTTTPTDTWQNSALSILNTNPIVLSSSGEATIYLDSSITYKFVLKNAVGATIWTVNNISGALSGEDLTTFINSLASSSGSALVGFIQSGTGAVLRDMQDKMRETVSVTDFMTTAQKADLLLTTPLLDQSASIQSAIDSGARLIRFPKGNYKVSAVVRLKDGVQLIGAGSRQGECTSIRFSKIDGTHCFDSDITDFLSGVTVQGMEVVNTANTAGTVASGDAFHLHAVTNNCKFKDLLIRNFGGDAFNIGPQTTNPADLTACSNVLFEQVFVVSCGGYAFDINGYVNAAWMMCDLNSCATGFFRFQDGVTNQAMINIIGLWVEGTQAWTALTVFNMVETNGQMLNLIGCNFTNGRAGTSRIVKSTTSSCRLSTIGCTGFGWTYLHEDTPSGFNSTLTTPTTDIYTTATKQIVIQGAGPLIDFFMQTGGTVDQRRFRESISSNFLEWSARDDAGASVRNLFKVNHATGAFTPSVDASYDFGGPSLRWLNSYVSKIHLSGSSTVFDSAGTGTPEGAVTAGIGSTFRRTDGGAGTCFYVKESGAGNTGWVAK